MDSVETQHVMVVDDDASLGVVLQALLGQGGYRASLARSARDALMLLQTQRVDVVLTDLRMPEMDGLTLLAQLKQGWPGLPVVMLTAHGSVPIAVAAMREGASDFLLKPFEREAVLATVARVLSESSRARGHASTESSRARGHASTESSRELPVHTERTQPFTEPQPLEEKVHATERAAISQALEQARGNRTLAARLLGVSRRTLYNKLAEHGIS